MVIVSSVSKMISVMRLAFTMAPFGGGSKLQSRSAEKTGSAPISAQHRGASPEAG
jgi:hypothetical protein